MSLEQIVNRLAEVADIVAEDPLTWARRTAPGLQIRQNNAREEQKQLRQQYRDTLRSAFGLVFVKGPEDKQQAFRDLVTDEDSAFTVDARGIYQEFTDAIETGIHANERVFDLPQHLRLVGLAADMGRKLKAFNLPNPKMAANQMGARVDDAKATFEMVRSSVLNGPGPALLHAWMSDQILTQAEEGKWTSSVVPAVIFNANEQEIAALLIVYPNHVIVDLDQEPVENNTLVKAYGKILRYSKMSDKNAEKAV